MRLLQSCEWSYRENRRFAPVFSILLLSARCRRIIGRQRFVLLQKRFLHSFSNHGLSGKLTVSKKENTCSLKSALETCRYPPKIFHQICLQFIGTTTNPTANEIANPVVKALSKSTTILIVVFISYKAPLEKMVEAKMVYMMTGIANCGFFARKTLISQILANSHRADTAAAGLLNGLPGSDGLFARARAAVHIPKRLVAAARQIAICYVYIYVNTKLPTMLSTIPGTNQILNCQLHQFRARQYAQREGGNDGHKITQSAVRFGNSVGLVHCGEYSGRKGASRSNNQHCSFARGERFLPTSPSESRSQRPVPISAIRWPSWTASSWGHW